MKKLNENFTSVCHYCGVIFKNNRSTAKFCSNKHRSLYGTYGAAIDPIVITADNRYINADDRLYAAYRSSQNLRGAKVAPGGWAHGFDEATFTKQFDYDGPLPEGDELLVVGSYILKGATVLQRLQFRYLLFVKPITALTNEERATATIISPKGEGEKEEWPFGASDANY